MYSAGNGDEYHGFRMCGPKYNVSTDGLLEVVLKVDGVFWIVLLKFKPVFFGGLSLPRC